MSFLEEDCNNIQHCPKLNRIINTIKWYEDATEKQILPYVMEYKSIIDDFHHILIAHRYHLEQIYDHITENMEFECNVSNCNIFSKTECKSDDSLIIFYTKLLDQIHCHIMHQFDTGLRLRPSVLRDLNDTKLSDEDRSSGNTELITVDQQFEHLSKPKNSHINFHRINKFNITSTAPAVSDISDNKEPPFIDLISNEMRKKGHSKKLQKILEYLHEEEYDSEAIKYDISQGSEKNSNIFRDITHITNLQFAQSLSKYVKNYAYRRIYAVFSTGYTFWYWIYYKNNNDSTQSEVLTNERTHSFTYSELYVAAKYPNLKNELRNNTIYPLDIIHYDTAMKKAMTYLETRVIKAMKSNEKKIVYHYGIGKGSKIKVVHLLSIVLYTDCTELSTHFTASFREIIRNETLSSIKQRNVAFANWAKFLRETIELYGKKIHKANGMPFFCGMSPLLLPSFLIRLNCPTSTTAAPHIAVNFAKDAGIIIELREANISQGGRLKYFNSVLLSSFSAENERTLIGGAFPIKVHNIRLQVDGKWNNFAPFCQSLFRFEIMINGAEPRGMRSDTKRDKFVTNKLIESLMEDKDDTHFPEYANRLFPHFCNERNLIILNVDSINKIFKNMKDSIFYKGGNMLNLEKITRIFPNVCTVKIMDYQCETTENKFDVSQFVLSCSDIFDSETNKVNKIILSAQRARDHISNKYTASWLYEEYTNIITTNATKIIISYHVENDFDVLSIRCNK